MRRQKEIGCLGLAAYLMFGIGILGFVMDAIQGEHKNEDGQWTSFDDIVNVALITLGIGIVLYIIDRIRNR
ncbi:MAG: hypothetical protein WCI31_07975 [Prolixibacteraceae bacterium]